MGRQAKRFQSIGYDSDSLTSGVHQRTRRVVGTSGERRGHPGTAASCQRYRKYYYGQDAERRSAKCAQERAGMHRRFRRFLRIFLEILRKTTTSSYLALFLVACTRLHKPLCRSVRPSVRPSLLARSTRLMAIGLVVFEIQ